MLTPSGLGRAQDAALAATHLLQNVHVVCVRLESDEKVRDVGEQPAPGAGPGAPAGEPWSTAPEVEAPVADPPHDSFNADPATGAFTGTVGHPPNFPVTIQSRVWVKVVVSSDPDHVAAYFRLGPFATPDGKGFVAPPDEDVSFTTADGITVDVPAGAGMTGRSLLVG